MNCTKPWKFRPPASQLSDIQGNRKRTFSSTRKLSVVLGFLRHSTVNRMRVELKWKATMEKKFSNGSGNIEYSHQQASI